MRKFYNNMITIEIFIEIFYFFTIKLKSLKKFLDYAIVGKKKEIN